MRRLENHCKASLKKILHLEGLKTLLKKNRLELFLLSFSFALPPYLLHCTMKAMRHSQVNIKRNRNYKLKDNEEKEKEAERHTEATKRSKKIT